MNRINNRKPDELREMKMIPGYIKHPQGSVLIEMGETKVICSATVEEKVPFFLKNTGTGWITAEYSMLPGATHTRNVRESSKGKISGRTQEIQRLIGRALRSVVDLKALGEKTIWIDCDVIQADGGTRTAAITGAFVALALAVEKIYSQGKIKTFPIKNYVSAISIGVIEGTELLDLCYEEDSRAHVDMNVVMTDQGEFIEVQGTGEEAPFSKEQLLGLLTLAEKGNRELIRRQREILGPVGEKIPGTKEGE